MYQTEFETRNAGCTPREQSKTNGTRAALVRLLLIQAAISVAIALAVFWHQQTLIAVAAALFGGGIGMGTSALLGFRLIRASRPGAGLSGIYIGAIERFVFVGGAFALGIAVLGLGPVAMLAGFAGAQCGYFIAAGGANRKAATHAGGQHGG